MIIGAILFFSGIIVSILWAGSFFKTLLNQGMFLADISIPASSFNNNTLQINDIDHPIIPTSSRKRWNYFRKGAFIIK